MQEDINLCTEIMLMRQFAHFSAMEDRGQKLEPEQRRFLIQVEKAAGVI